MAYSEEVGVQRAPGESSDGHFPGLVIPEPPEREESATPLFEIISYILIVLEVCSVGNSGRNSGRRRALSISKLEICTYCITSAMRASRAVWNARASDVF